MNTLLLDTHTFLWFVMGDPRISAAVRSLIADPANTTLFSVASCWEMAIKSSLGKLTLAEPLNVLVPREMKRNGFRLLGVKLAHTVVVAGLPLHHRDPFDRLLVAQAMVERATLVSADPALDAYPISRFW